MGPEHWKTIAKGQQSSGQDSNNREGSFAPIHYTCEMSLPSTSPVDIAGEFYTAPVLAPASSSQPAKCQRTTTATTSCPGDKQRDKYGFTVDNGSEQEECSQLSYFLCDVLVGLFCIFSATAKIVILQAQTLFNINPTLAHLKLSICRLQKCSAE
jgi:hypothetical protein